MWRIVGLGNPGKIYANTRHNIGFMVIDALSSKYSITLGNKSKNFVCGWGRISEKNVVLLKPLTFMNKSGIAVRSALKKTEGVDNLLVVHDDIDLDMGIIRIRKNGSAGGHKGVESIIEAISTKDFLRLKIGIGHSDKFSAEEYVLSPFTKREQPIMKKTIEKAVDAIEIILDKGVSYAQNKFHRD